MHGGRTSGPSGEPYCGMNLRIGFIPFAFPFRYLPDVLLLVSPSEWKRAPMSRDRLRERMIGSEQL